MSDYVIQVMGREPFGITTDGQMFVDPIGTDWITIVRKGLGFCKHEGEICSRCFPDWRREFYMQTVQVDGSISRIGADRLPVQTPTGVSL